MEGIIFGWVVLLSIFLIRYKFPHFGMHFTSTIFTINSFNFEKKCNIHTEDDITKFKQRQKVILKLLFYVGVVLIIIGLVF